MSKLSWEEGTVSFLFQFLMPEESAEELAWFSLTMSEQDYEENGPNPSESL